MGDLTQAPTLAALVEREVELIRANRMIEAIKAVMARTGLGLREAKDLVDAHRRLLFRPAVNQPSGSLAALVEEAERLDREATPGPWRSTWDDPIPEKIDHDDDEITVEAVGREDDRLVVGLAYYDGRHAACTRENAAFIARARTLLPELARLLADALPVMRAAAKQDAAEWKGHAERCLDTEREIGRFLAAHPGALDEAPATDTDKEKP